ncbi:MAG: GTP-binding protein, partial [Alphaproteobacteria bacterium]|nr:GTP-binding protein [Alphaproteobacteria bacterium]
MASFQYVYVMKGMSKAWPGGKEVLKDIWLSFLPGAKIGIIGPNGAGKSTLLNALAQREVAIVSPIAGTTRDVLEVPLNLGGYPVLLIDTAGLRDFSTDVIEIEGIKRARARIDTADLRILVLDPTQPVSAQMQDADITIWSKADLAA